MLVALTCAYKDKTVVLIMRPAILQGKEGITFQGTNA